MVSAGAGVSQQGQNQVSMDAQTCLACKSNWCTTWPQEVNAHVHGRLMAEYPTPRLVWVKRTTLSVSQGRSRRENYASHERLYSFISVRIPVSQRSCQAALYGNEQNREEMSEIEYKTVTYSLLHGAAPVSLAWCKCRRFGVITSQW